MSSPPLRLSHQSSGGGRGPWTVADARARWQQSCEAAHLDAAHVDAIWAQLAAAYGAESRTYHNLQHLGSVFEFIRFAAACGYPLQDAAVVDLAVWFHDAVQNPCSSSNEADSAALAERLLDPAGLSPGRLAKVKRIILATQEHHHVEGDTDCDLVVDADLAILGAPLQRYTDYAEAVRREYGHLSDAEYCTGRAKLLKGLLDREQLFLTDIGKSCFEAAARANMSHEWRLVFAGQLLSTNALNEEDENLPEGSESLSTAPSAGTDGASLSGGAAAGPDLAAAAAAAAAAAGADVGAPEAPRAS